MSKQRCDTEVAFGSLLAALDSEIARAQADGGAVQSQGAAELTLVRERVAQAEMQWAALCRVIAAGVVRREARAEGARVEVAAAASDQKLALSRAEAAERLGVSTVTLDRLVERGLVRPSRATRRPMFAVWELERFLRETAKQVQPLA